MLRQYSPRNILSSIGLCLLAVVLLTSAGARKAKAETTSYDDDARRVAAVAAWVSGAWSFIAGARTAIDFLTDSEDPPVELTLENIHDVFVNALDQRHDSNLIEGVEGLAAYFHNIIVRTKLQASNAEQAGQTRESILKSDFAREYLANALSSIDMDGTYLFTALNKILQLPSTPVNDKRVYAVMPAYTMLVPLLVSSMELVGEIDPLLKSDEVIAETLELATESLFMAAGAYGLSAHTDRCIPEIIFTWLHWEFKWTCKPFHFYAPVGKDVSFLRSRPLYAYHTVDLSTQRFQAPDKPFYMYQTIPVVKLALDTLESIGNVACSMVSADNVLIWDPGVDTTSLVYDYNYGSRVPHADGWIKHVHQGSGTSRCTTPQRGRVPALPQ